MAATPKPVRKAIKKRVLSINKMMKSDPDVKKSGMGKQEIKSIKKSDSKDIKKIVKTHGPQGTHQTPHKKHSK